MSEFDSELPGAPSQTQEVMMAEVRYAIVFGEMNELVHARLHKLLNWVTIFASIMTVGGAATLITKASANAGASDALGVATFVMLILAGAAEATKRAYKFDQKEVAFRDAKKAFQELEGRGWQMNQGNLAREISKLRAKAPAGGYWLSSAAFNRACEELGHAERHRPEPRYVRVFRHALAG